MTAFMTDFESNGAMELGDSLVYIAKRVAEIGHDNVTAATAIEEIQRELRSIGLGDILDGEE